MYTSKQLNDAFKNALLIVNFKGGFDSFAFRKGFEREFLLDNLEKEMVLEYLKKKVQKGSPVYVLVKSSIDNQEFLTTDYYANPNSPRRFRGAYCSVVYKTLAGLMISCI